MVTFVGNFQTKVGYNKIVTTIYGNEEGNGLVEALILIGNTENFVYNFDNQKDWFLWGRRGPGGAFWHDISETTDILYYYSEVFVPSGFDTVGSYFCAQQFSEGYFGIQVNSLT